MAGNSKLLSLFGWKTNRPPKDTTFKGDEVSSSLGEMNPYESYLNTVRVPVERRKKYDDYDGLDEQSEVSSVLDAYAEDATQTDREHRSSIWIDARNAKAKKILLDLKKRLRWDDYVESIARDTGKYGDDFAVLDTEEGVGITGWDWRDPRSLERIENRQGTLVGFEKTAELKQTIKSLKQGEKVSYTFKPWDVIHFRLYKRKREKNQPFRNIYGTSLLAGSEKIGKQMKIIDDMLMVRRLTKTLDTRKYNIDTGRSAVEEEVQILKRWKNALKRTAYIDPANARFDARFDPFSWQEDIFWPVKEGSTSGVDVIPGQPNVSDLLDVDHFVNKFYGSLRAPKAYFGHEGDINGKASLASQDIKWGRAVNSLQKAVRNGFFRLCQIELALHGLDPNQEFTVNMVVPSVLEDLSRLEAMQTMIDMAERLASLGETMGLDPETWKAHILASVMGMSDAEIKMYMTVDSDDAPDDQNAEPDDEDDSDSNEDTRSIQEILHYALSKKLGKGNLGSDISEHARPSELPKKGEVFEFDHSPTVPLSEPSNEPDNTRSDPDA